MCTSVVCMLCVCCVYGVCMVCVWCVYGVCVWCVCMVCVYGVCMGVCVYVCLCACTWVRERVCKCACVGVSLCAVWQQDFAPVHRLLISKYVTLHSYDYSDRKSKREHTFGQIQTLNLQYLRQKIFLAHATTANPHYFVLPTTLYGFRQIPRSRFLRIEKSTCYNLGSGSTKWK